MTPASIDPGAWLASHDIKAWLDAGRDDPLAVGRDELIRADGDLARALEACPDGQAEIVLAWLAGLPPEAVADGVMVAAWVVGGG
jgi:hypothetical protein